MVRIVPVVAASVSVAAGVSAPVLAEQVSVDLLLDTPTASVNTIELTVGAFGFTGSDSSTVSGNALTDLDIDFLADGQVDTINTLSFAGGEVLFDQDLSFNINVVLGNIAIDGFGLGGELDTPGGPSAVDAAGDFDLTPHQLNVNQGTLTAVGSGLASAINTNLDFSVEPIAASLTGTANVAVTLDSIVGDTATYTTTLSAPISFTEPFDANGVQVDVSASGNLFATGSFTRILGVVGDLDGDGYVGQSDLGLILADWGTAGSPADADASGNVDEADLDIVLNNFGQGTPPNNAVPEPTSLALLALGSLAFTRRRRR